MTFAMKPNTSGKTFKPATVRKLPITLLGLGDSENKNSFQICFYFYEVLQPIEKLQVAKVLLENDPTK